MLLLRMFETPHRTAAGFEGIKAVQKYDPSTICYRYGPVKTSDWRLSTKESVPCRLADH